MRRIILMVTRLFLKAPYYLYRIWKCGADESITFEESFAYVKKVTKAANKAGRVKIEAYGLENIPKENGFVFFPNHQGLFDVLVFLESCPVPFSFVIKKEASNIILLKQVVKALEGIPMDREDIKQSMQVILQMTEKVKQGRNFLIFPEGTRSKMGNKLLPFKGGTFKSAVKAKCPIVLQMTEKVKQGRNFLIFPEGTRSKMGNKLLPFKGGTFKSAVKAKCPIVPCALIDSFRPFDEKSIKPVTVKVIYLQPMYYDEYAGMKTTEIAEEVKRRIEAAIFEYEKP